MCQPKVFSLLLFLVSSGPQSWQCRQWWWPDLLLKWLPSRPSEFFPGWRWKNHLLQRLMPLQWARRNVSILYIMCTSTNFTRTYIVSYTCMNALPTLPCYTSLGFSSHAAFQLPPESSQRKSPADPRHWVPRHKRTRLECPDVCQHLIQKRWQVGA